MAPHLRVRHAPLWEPTTVPLGIGAATAAPPSN